MYDDGAHGDGPAGDNFFGAVLPSRAHNVVVEFYIEARDLEGNIRTWPGPVQPGLTQSANLLYQVNDNDYTGRQPLYLLIMTEAERAELDQADRRLGAVLVEKIGRRHHRRRS